MDQDSIALYANLDDTAPSSDEIDEGKEDAHAADDAVEPIQTGHILPRDRHVHSPQTCNLLDVSRRRADNQNDSPDSLE